MKPIRTLTKFPRSEPEIPNDVTSEVLTNPTLKHSGPFRRTMMRARQRVVELPRTEPKKRDALVAKFARTRNVTQLINHIKRGGRALNRLSRQLCEAESSFAALPTSIDLIRVVTSLRLVIADTNQLHEACKSEFEWRTNPPSKQ